MELMAGCQPKSKEVGERKGCACVCAEGGRVQKSETGLETGMGDTEDRTRGNTVRQI